MKAKKTTLIILTSTWMTCLSTLLTSCSENEPLKPTPIAPTPPTDNLALNVMDISSNYHAGSQNVNVYTNTAWEATCEQSWVSISPTDGTGDTSIVISWTENTEKSLREALITISANKLKQEIQLKQKAKADTAHLLSYRAIVGNLLHDERDSVELTFDKPVKLKAIEFSRVLPDFKPEYFGGGRIVRHEIGRGRMGETIQTKFMVESSDGTRTDGDLPVNFFNQRLTFEGSVRHVLVSDDEESLWVSVSRKFWESGNNYDKLLQISVEDGHILKEIDMPFAPGYLTMNPHNGQLYALPWNFSSDLGYTNSFCRIDPKQGKITATYVIEPSAKAHPQHPPIYPSELEFTNDGLGVLVLVEKDGDGLEWRYVNSSEDDKITENGYHWSEFRFEHVYASHDHQRVYANEYYAIYNNLSYITSQHLAPQRYEILSSFNSDKYYAGGVMMDMVFSPWDERVFICTAPGSQCVVTLEPQVGYSEVTEAEARGAKAAWDRSNPQQDWIYQVCSLDQHLLLLDMKRADCLFYCAHSWGRMDLIDVRHILKTDQLLVATPEAIWLLDAAHMKRGTH